MDTKSVVLALSTGFEMKP
uniref:Uncharacterized protein n=1 Tax=Anguilla anguilla TaxID=7936 RepID=A0A0E9TKD4_ANGAN